MIYLALLSGMVGDTHIVHLELSQVKFFLKSKWSPLRSGFTIYSELLSFPFSLISFTAFYLGCDRSHGFEDRGFTNVLLQLEQASVDHSIFAQSQLCLGQIGGRT
jgi:hypothetical protein